jgi:hypothetical protein
MLDAMQGIDTEKLNFMRRMKSPSPDGTARNLSHILTADSHVVIQGYSYANFGRHKACFHRCGTGNGSFLNTAIFGADSESDQGRQGRLQ